MKFRCDKTELLSGINIALKAVPKKTTMPILECILINAKKEYIEITGNDMELGINTKISGEVIEEGQAAVNAKMISDVIRKLPDNVVTVLSDDDLNIKITCEKSKFNLTGKDGEEFPKLPEISRDDFITVTEFGFKEIVKQVIFPACTKHVNKLMTGVYFTVDEDILKAEALDSHRIAIRQLTLDKSYEPKGVIIPVKTLNELTRILTDSMDSEIRIYFTKNNVIFEFGKTVIISRIIEGEYFKINRMLNHEHTIKATVNKTEFLECMDRSTLFIREGDRKPVLVNISDDGEMTIETSSVYGSMHETLEAETFGEPLEIGFNPKYVLDVLKVVDDEEITMYLTNGTAPCTIKDDAGKYNYLILPVAK